MNGDDLAGITLVGIIVVLLTAGLYAGFTDEYEVKEIQVCTQNKIAYQCSRDGEGSHVIAICDTKEECNKKCDEMRKRE